MSTTSTEQRDRQVGPYRIERELGRGGMGIVYLASRSDLEYRKQVAIKLIHGHRGDELASRFRAERQILANLEHPNIARLLDGGSTPEGDPYIAMEYVRDGLPIDEWCRRNKLTLTQKLEKFRAVCSAVQHAHQHLIVHRDLKPGNILVTPEGDVKLLDFGIARPLAPLTRELTVASNQAGTSMTPDYASPEQQAGQPVGTASDIYSLGVVLFEMLTGIRPDVSKASFTLWAAPAPEKPSVYRGETLTFERMPRSIPSDLASIILMALRQDSDSRYGSAGEMLQDIERFLDGRPVTAHPDRFAYRAMKFSSRNRFVIGGVALLILSLVGGVVATTREAHLADAERIQSESRAAEAEVLRRQADKLRTLAEQQSKIASQKSEEAQKERAQAVEQRDITLQLASTLVADVDGSLAKLEGSLPTRKILVAKALEALDQLHKAASDDPKILLRLAASYQALGALERSRYAANLGDTPGALKSYQHSLDLTREAEKLLDGAPNHEMRGVTLGMTAQSTALAYCGIGDVNDINDKRTEALSFYLKCLASADKGARAMPDVFRAARTVMIAEKKVGDVYAFLEHWDEAESHYRRAAEISETNIRRFPNEKSIVRDRTVSLSSFAQLLRARKKYELALAQFEMCLRLIQKAFAANPNDASLKRDLFAYYAQSGDLKVALNRPAEAQADLEKALAIAELRYRPEEANLQSLYDLADAHFNISRSLDALGRTEEAKRHLLLSGELAKRSAKIDPNAYQTKFALSRVEEALAAHK